MAETIDPMTGAPRRRGRPSTRERVRGELHDATTEGVPGSDTIGTDRAAPPSPVAFSTPDDIDIPRDSFVDQAKDWIRGVGRKTDEPEPSRPRARRSSKTSDIDEALSIPSSEFASIFLVPLMALAFKLVPSQIRANNAELSNISVPMARILYRHVTILKKLGPDFLDVCLILGVLVAYGERVAAETDARKQGIRPSLVLPTPAQTAVQRTEQAVQPTAAQGDDNGTATVADYLGLNKGA